MKKMFLVFAMITAFAGIAQADLRICSNGICIGRDSDGRGVELTPERPPRRPGYGAEYITCESRDQRYTTCGYDNFRVHSVQITRVLSKASCVYGRTWGYDWNRVWVDRGCRADFRINRY